MNRQDLADWTLILVLAVLLIGTVIGLRVRVDPEVKVDTKEVRAEEVRELEDPENRKVIDVSEWIWPTECYECVKYIVKPGDKLWVIAERLYPNRDPRQMEWAIRRANGLEGPKGPIVHPGQELWIPDPKLYGVRENS